MEPESIIDSIEGEMDDMNDDVINITAEDDQLLTEDVSLSFSLRLWCIEILV